MSKKNRGNKVDGWFILNKGVGDSSTRELNQVKRLFNAQKAGHGGTLDPLACGVLPIALGEATKTVSYVMDGRKSYRFTITFGENRTTEDAEGEITETCERIPSMEELTNILGDFIGDIQQIPPIYSAIKVSGKRAYDLARAGCDVELNARTIHIYNLQLLSLEDNQATFAVDCGKGTYVRSLSRDILKKVNCCGHVTFLQRTKVGKFHIKDSFSIAKLAEMVHNGEMNNVLLDLSTVLDDILAQAVNAEMSEKIFNGLRININRIKGLSAHADGTKILILNADDNNRLVAIAEFQQDSIKSIRGFNL